jgi:hypothetical protein
MSGKSIDKFYQRCRDFTKSPTNLGLHFSDFPTIFYAISKFQQKPSVCGLPLRKTWFHAMWPLGSSAVWPNYSELAAGTGQARAKGDLRGPWARFRQEFGATVLPTTGLGGAGRRLPLDCSLRRALGRGKEWSGTPSSSRD